MEQIQIGRNFDNYDLLQWYNISKIKPKKPQPDMAIPNDDVLAKILANHGFIYKYVEQDTLLERKPETLKNFEQKDAWMNFYIDEQKLLNPGVRPKPLEHTLISLGRPQPKQSLELPESPEPMEIDAQSAQIQPEKMVLGTFKDRIFFDVLQKTARQIYPEKRIDQIWNEYMPIVLNDLFDQLDNMNYTVIILFSHEKF